ncbi:MAG: SAM-dependent methyltransferase [Candidatus Methanohalarchaeum thermophilum]|uniref:SAM-dependent methyltransferase n=1 Tax=Methanohalarchaeum thermophilum TaxID=1903181 RepID=A0A1Q6DWS3_METT1|nr:MAG: SAM-dependent methyltransferase [Candidatus Methanohalarchaeum thermophilum]
MGFAGFRSEREKMWEEVLSDLEVEGCKVIDVGVGESTEKLVEAGAQVVGVDTDIEKLKGCELDVPLIKCDILNFPFERRIADLTFFNFILHEINPQKHSEAIRLASHISPEIAVIEPSPEVGSVYQRFNELQQEIIESLGGYEEY